MQFIQFVFLGFWMLLNLKELLVVTVLWDQVYVYTLMHVCVSEQLQREREILQERADKRVEILQNLASKTVHLSSVDSEVKLESAELSCVT